MGRKPKTPGVQMNFSDRFLNLSKRGQDAVRNSDLGHFGDEIFPKIDPKVFEVLYSDNGRGPYYLQGMVAAYMIMKGQDLSVDEMLLRIDSDIAIQYALHTTSMEHQPFSRRNMFYFIAKLETYEKETGINLIEKCFHDVTGQLAHDMGLDRPGETGRIKRRMDSMMIGTYAAKLSRPGIVYMVNQDALILYAGLNGEERILPSLRHYFDEDDKNAIIYHNKDDMMGKLTVLLAESKQILALMEEDEWHEFQEYKNLVRCIEEQSMTDADGNVVPKKNGKIEGSSMQSPQDPKATARTKAGKTYIGYVGNVTETYDGKGHGLITDADIKSNDYSDSEFMQDTIAAKKDEVEEQITTDGAYYSSDNAKAAAEKGVLLTPTSLTGSETAPLCAEFTLSDDGERIEKCPNGCEPIEQTFHENTGKIDAKFSHEDCDHCPYCDECPGKAQKKAVKVSISQKMVDRAELQNALGDEEHKQMARERNGVEAIPSIFRRKYGIDHIRTFVDSRIRSAYFAVCLAFNCMKHRRYTMRQGKLCPGT